MVMTEGKFSITPKLFLVYVRRTWSIFQAPSNLHCAKIFELTGDERRKNAQKNNLHWLILREWRVVLPSPSGGHKRGNLTKLRLSWLFAWYSSPVTTTHDGVFTAIGTIVSCFVKLQRKCRSTLPCRLPFCPRMETNSCLLISVLPPLGAD